MEKVRHRVLEYFNADSRYFDVIFVANATAAIKIILEAFRERDYWYGYHKDAHTSIVGIREYAATSRCFMSNDEVEDWIESSRDEPVLSEEKKDKVRLFAYPAQSNMTGHRPPLSWPQKIRERYGNCYVVLDAASFLTTSRLDLSAYDQAPDFVSLSFYKVFGFPDLGALLVRKSASDMLKTRKYFGGGTVDMIINIDTPWHALKPNSLHDILEDGTLPFHNIIALDHALSIQERLFGRPSKMSQHVVRLSYLLYTELRELCHHNGRLAVEIYKEADATYGNPATQGPIIAFNLQDSDGNYIGKSQVEMLAIACGMQLRTGGVCNPGGIASMLQLQSWELRRNFAEGVRCGNEVDVIGGKPAGIVRISLGPMSTKTDVLAFTCFVRQFFVETRSSSVHRFDDRVNQSTCPKLTCRSPAANTSFEFITPVKNLQAFRLPSRSDRSAKEVFDSYAVWHEQWQLVEPNSRSPLSAEHATKHSLLTSLQANSGTLRISQHALLPSAPFEASNTVPESAPLPQSSNCLLHISSTDLLINIWSLPADDSKVATSDSGEKWHMYEDERIVSWLTAAVGTPCTLARRQGRTVAEQMERLRCVVRKCSAQFEGMEALRAHYKEHAVEFEDVLRSHGIDRGSQQPAVCGDYRAHYIGHVQESHITVVAQPLKMSDISSSSETTSTTEKLTRKATQEFKKTSRWRAAFCRKNRGV